MRSSSAHARTAALAVTVSPTAPLPPDDLLDLAARLVPALRLLPRTITGRHAVRRLLALGRRRGGWGQALQMEWLGFFFQEHLGTLLKALGSAVTAGGDLYRNTRFDFTTPYESAPLDVKVHVGRRAVPLNDMAATEAAVAEHGAVFVLVALATAAYCATGEFRAWQYALVGQTPEGPQGRRRKVRAEFSEFLLVKIDAAGLRLLQAFHQGRNSNTAPRAPKYKATRRRLMQLPHVVLTYAAD